MNGDIIICGGGIIGASIAYHLTLKGVAPIVVERCEVAAAASGKAGGFLAGEWGSGVTADLHRKSFAMHGALAKTLGLQSYRPIPVLSVTAGKKPKPSQHCTWLDGSIAKSSLMDSGTAQVTPKELTCALMDAAVSNGARVVIGKVEGLQVVQTGDGMRQVQGVVVDGKPLPAAKVVIAMGPWSVFATDWLQISVPMEGIWSTSVVYKNEGTQRTVAEPFALFCAEDDNGCHLEVYPRPNGDVYLCGIGGSAYTSPEDIKQVSPSEVTPNPKRVVAAHRSFSRMTSLAEDGPTSTQACMRPCLSDGLPMMGLVPATENAFIACGHNCWGILWAPVTGLAMAELIVDGRASVVDLKPFNPGRFGNLQGMRGQRGRQQVGQPVGEQW
jgi:glycine/D-amino acid oxidase-like deaminating enzyme